jgi:methyl coenzyme M reductase beta subunit
MKTTITVLRSSRRSLLLALASALSLAVLISTTHPAQAVNGIGRTCYYYSDASHAHQVGKAGYDCCGRRFSQGTITQYSVCESVFCGAGGCPPPPQ